ncbi:putative helicase mov-10-B.2 [Cloeon dipterum]
MLVRSHDRGTVTLTEGDGAKLLDRELLVALWNQRCRLQFLPTLVGHRLRVTGSVDGLSALADYFQGGGLGTKECGIPLVDDHHLAALKRGEGFMDEMLNQEQRRAVVEILEHRRPHVPYLLVGPPGTGKSATLDEVVLQLATHHKEKRTLDALIYYVVPSNLGVRSTAERLLRLGMRSEQLVRLYSEHEHVKGTDPLRDISQRASRMQHLITTSVVIGTPIAIARIGLTLGERNPPPLLLLLDEAAYIKLGEAFAALTANGEPVQTVLAGDRKQLRPRCFSKVAESMHGKYSLFDLAADSGFFEDDGLRPKEGLGVMLRLNYRAHEKLVREVSCLFYNGLMIPGPASLPSNSLLLLRFGLERLGLDANQSAIRWVDIDGAMQRDPLTRSLFNVVEADAVVSVVDSLCRCIPPQQVTVLAPYRKQVAVLREKLPRDITVFTADEVIGQERPVIVVSLVRSDRGEDNARDHGVGFLREPNRVNVLISRAKEIVILVGSRAHFIRSGVGFWGILPTRTEPLPAQF